MCNLKCSSIKAGGSRTAFWVYLKASYKHRFYRHLRLLLIFACLMFLPLSLSIYRDSMVHGVELYNNRPHEYDLRIFHVGYEHLSYFEQIPYLEFSMHEDFIGVKILEGAQISQSTTHLSHLWDVWGAVDVYGALFNEIVDEIRSDGYSDVFLLSGHPGKTDLSPFGDILFSFTIILLAVSIGALVYAGRSHIKLFMSDIGAMAAYGAEKKQLRRIFIAEFAISFILSAILASGLSSFLMILVIKGIVQTTAPGAMWVVFNVNWLNVIFIILAFFIVGLISFALTLSKTLNQSSVYLISSVDENMELARRKKAINIQSPISALTSILTNRTKNIRGVLVISVLLIVAIVAIYNFMANIIYYEFSPNNTHLSVSKETGYGVTVYDDDGWNYESHLIKTPGFSEEDAAFVRNIAGIASVQVQVIDDHFLDWMFITLNDTQESGVVYQQLLNHFGDNGLYSVQNNLASAEADKNMQTGLHIMTLLVFAVLLAIVLIMIYLRVTGYVETQSKNICVLRTIGAECKDILRAFTSTAFNAATIGVAASFALGVGGFHALSYAAYVLFGDKAVMVFNVQAIIIQLFACALIYAAFMWTMRTSVGKILNTELFKTRRQSAWQ